MVLIIYGLSADQFNTRQRTAQIAQDGIEVKVLGIRDDPNNAFIDHVREMSSPDQERDEDYWLVNEVSDLDDDDHILIDDLLETVCDYTPESKLF